MEQIKDYFEKIYSQTKEDWLVFASKLIRQEFPKKTILLKAGQTENYLSFIEKGMVRLYVPRQENDITFGFVFKNEFVSAYDSFITRNPASYSTETLADTVLWSLTHNDLQDVYNKTKTGNSIGRFAAENLLIKNQDVNYPCLLIPQSNATLTCLQSGLN